MFDVKIINETVHESQGTMKATKLGKMKVQIKQMDGTTKTIVLQPVKCFAGAKVNLLSITVLLS